MTTQVFMRFPNGSSKALTFSYDDGVEQDRRLIEIFDKYGMRATFNINSACYADEGKVFSEGTVHRRLTHKAALELYGNSSHEVAVHGLTHAYLDNLPPLSVMEEIVQDRKNLEADFGMPIRGLAYAFGRYTDTAVNILKNAGIVYARTTVSTKKFNMPSDWLRLDATCHHRDSELMTLADRFVNTPSETIPRLFYVWGHSYEFEQDDNWDVIENFCSYMSGKNDIWYATNIEIFEYTEAYNRLVWSADMSVVKNPTSIPITFTVSRKGGGKHTFTVNPNEKLRCFDD